MLYMSNISSVLGIINNSVLTTIGYDSMSELSVLNLFSYISSKNPENVIRFNTSGLKTNDKNIININNIEEIYEEVSKLQNKIIIVECVSVLPSKKLTTTFNNPTMGRAKILKDEVMLSREYCVNNNCSIIIGSHTYLSPGTTARTLFGGSTLSYMSDTIAYVCENLLNLEKCRFDDTKYYKDIDIGKGLLRQENLEILLD